MIHRTKNEKPRNFCGYRGFSKGLTALSRGVFVFLQRKEYINPRCAVKPDVFKRGEQ